MTYISNNNFLLETARKNNAGVSPYNKFGSNSDIDTGSAPEDICGYPGLYTGFDATAGEAIGVRSTGAGSGNDTGSLVTSGTSTGGSDTTLEDTGTNFIVASVSVGDMILNDTDQFHGVVTAVTSATVLTVIAFDNGDAENPPSFETGKTYRIVQPSGSGACVVKVIKALETDYAEYKSEYVIMNGSTEVDTVGTDYIRCSRAKVVLWGSGGTTDGTIVGRQTTTTANVFWEIESDHDQTLVACDTIPAGHTLYITGISAKMARANGSAGSAEVDFKTRQVNTTGFNTKIHEYISHGAPFDPAIDYILAVTQFSDFKWSCNDVSDNNTQISAQINGFLVANNS